MSPTDRFYFFLGPSFCPESSFFVCCPQGRLLLPIPPSLRLKPSQKDSPTEYPFEPTTLLFAFLLSPPPLSFARGVKQMIAWSPLDLRLLSSRSLSYATTTPTSSFLFLDRLNSGGASPFLRSPRSLHAMVLLPFVAPICARWSPVDAGKLLPLPAVLA